ncbi:MAG: hypothetical protein DWQ01_05240 [Planctomycetota bacterium]|nr:MAG: hypothetical protein DWQ01_05240 [Planctomycetota bacterium]
MWNFLACLLLGFAGGDDPQKELAQMCQKVAKAESLRFTATTTTEMSGLERPGAGGGSSGSTPQTVEGQYIQGQPLHLKSDKLEAYRKDSALVFRQGDGQWSYFERTRRFSGPPPEGGSGGPPRGEGERERPPRGEGGAEDRPPRGEGGGPPEGGQRAQFGNRRSAMRVAFQLQSVATPGKLLSGMGAHAQNVRKSEQDGKLVFQGELTKAGVEALERQGGNRRSQGGPDFQRSGQFTISANAEGRIEKIEVITKMEGEFRGRSIKRTRHTVMDVRDVGQVEFEIPEEVAKLFESGADPGPEF